MNWLFFGLQFLVFFATLAMMIREGLWNNTLAVLNAIFSGILAFTLYGVVAVAADGALDGEFTYVFDFISMWLVFAVATLVLRAVCDSLSKTRVRFKLPVEQAGGIVVALLGAYLMTGFVGATMHTAPLAADFCDSALIVEDDNWGGLTRPDLLWLRMVGGLMTDDQWGESWVQDDMAQFPIKDEYSAELRKKFTAAHADVNLDAEQDLQGGKAWMARYVTRYVLRRFQFVDNGAKLKVTRG